MQPTVKPARRQLSSLPTQWPESPGSLLSGRRCSRRVAWKPRRGARSVVALKHFSGHDTPVSSPTVNEKGIVVRTLSCLFGGPPLGHLPLKAPCNGLSSTHDRYLVRLDRLTQQRRCPSRRSCAPTVGRSQCACSGRAQSWACARCVAAMVLPVQRSGSAAHCTFACATDKPPAAWAVHYACD